jgi:hypothetical protein
MHFFVNNLTNSNAKLYFDQILGVGMPHGWAGTFPGKEGGIQVLDPYLEPPVQRNDSTANCSFWSKSQFAK